MDDKSKKHISKFLSLVLRHEPQKIGITLDDAGWIDVDELLRASAAHRMPFTRAELDEVVATNEKQRFAFSDDRRRIRASQGHSVEVDLGYTPAIPPERLYHGTATRFLDSIAATGLHRGERHDVHLSEVPTTATSVGSRHGKAVVLTIRAAEMHRAGHVFKRSANGVWLTESIPRLFIDFPTLDAAPSSPTAITAEPRLHRVVASQRYPLLFVTISGAHLYGFPSPDSDFDLRGVHIRPPDDLLGLIDGPETIESTGVHDGLEIDLVTHDAKKFFGLLLKKNGYVLEQLFSPLVVHATPDLAELRAIGQTCITRHHAHHYFGFVQTQWKLFEKESPRRVKPLLYVFRVLLTGIHLMKTSQVEANLVTLNEHYRLLYITDLVARKLAGPEQSTLSDDDFNLYATEYERLCAELQAAYDASTLQEVSPAKLALHDLLLRIRRKGS